MGGILGAGNVSGNPAGALQRAYRNGTRRIGTGEQEVLRASTLAIGAQNAEQLLGQPSQRATV